MEISTPDPLYAWYQKYDVTCYGAGDGQIAIFGATGGTDGYEFSIDNGSTWSYTTYYDFLQPGAYYIWMRDASHVGCTLYLGYEYISQPDPMTATVDYTDATCNGACDGTITISNPPGGAHTPGTFEFSIDNGNTWSTDMVYTGLCFGQYMVKMSPLQGTFFEIVPTSHDLALIGAAVSSRAK